MTAAALGMAAVNKLHWLRDQRRRRMLGYAELVRREMAWRRRHLVIVLAEEGSDGVDETREYPAERLERRKGRRL